LLRRDPKALVIACNTVSAIALEPIVALSPVPVIDVVRPGARAAADFTRSGRVGVVATEATVRSQAYRRAILGLKPDAEVFQSAAPLLVPLAEEGWPPDGPVVRGALERYLGPLREARVDTVVLGCTHYPLLKPAFRAALDDDVFLVDSAEETGEALSRTLRERGWVRPAVKVPARRFLVTDNPERFRSLGARFLWDRTLEVEETAL
ncbi:MAG: glutamate racemase, partial [Planctomycetes bacterium]|nr:glutamate racemase [Planctomycetota bacterium]